jgi:hypothetical protein
MYFVGENEPQNEREWIFFDGSTQAHILITDLPQKAKIYVRVKGINKDRSAPWLQAIYILMP